MSLVVESSAVHILPCLAHLVVGSRCTIPRPYTLASFTVASPLASRTLNHDRAPLPPHSKFERLRCDTEDNFSGVYDSFM